MEGAELTYQTETVGARSARPVASASKAAAGMRVAIADLKSLSSIRTVIVLKEILGAPRALDPMSDLPALR